MFQSEFYAHRDEIIKIIGIGGGGCNAVNYMHTKNMKNVNFYICNTDAQSLEHSTIENKIHIGPELTQGLGAGSNPEVGRQATLESEDYIRSLLSQNTKMVFITAGMGGGTGTGGAPIIAKVAKDLGVLTIGIVTTPFKFEGKKRLTQAEEGIKALKDYVDTLVIISNENLKNMYSDLSMSNAFNKADDILLNSTKCVTDVINTAGKINVDFADVCTVMKNGGVAVFGSAEKSGEGRAEKVIREAIKSPLLNDNDIAGAKWLLLNISSPKGDYEITMDEIDIIQEILRDKVGEESDIILGTSYDEQFTNQIGITLIATNFQQAIQQSIQSSSLQHTKIPKVDISSLPNIEMTTQVEEETKLEYTEDENQVEYLQTTLNFEQHDDSDTLNETDNSVTLSPEMEAEIIEKETTTPTTIQTEFSIQKPQQLYQEEESDNHTINENTEDKASDILEFEIKETETEINEEFQTSHNEDENNIIDTSENIANNVNDEETYTPSTMTTVEENKNEGVNENNVFESFIASTSNDSQQEEPLEDDTPINIDEKLSSYSINPSQVSKKVLDEQPSYLRNEAIKKFIYQSNQKQKPDMSNYSVVEDKNSSQSKINALNQFLFGHKPD